MSKTLARVLCSLALLGLLNTPVAAQETTGQIQGTVRDQSGAVLPGVTVAARHVQTGRVTETVTNEVGQYTMPLLQPGTYEVVFTLSGFQSSTVRGIELSVADRREINGRLGVSQLTETIEVSAATQFVQPNPAVQTLIGPTQVQELPLNNRSFVQLATLVPGVSSDLPDEVGIGLTATVSISINGGRRNAVNWMVDGVSNVDVGSNITLLSTPTLESIQEFKIITSSYAAEYPRSGGGVINIVTKGGGQKFSGTAYEFYRDEKFNANSFFRNLSTNPQLNSGPAPLDYHNFGYTIGGPMLPSREKAFFFWSQEWRRIKRAGSTTATVPQAAWLNDPANPNYVPPAQRDPMALRLLEAWPAPNVGLGSFLNENPGINNTRQEVIRADVDVRRDWKIVARYTHDLSRTQEPGGLFFGVVVPNVATTDTDVPGQILALESRNTWRNFLNEFKYQYSSNRITNSTPGFVRNTRAQFGLNNTELFPENNADRIPTIVVSGTLSTMGATQGFRNHYYNNTISNTSTWLRGRHAFKGGVLMAFEVKNEYSNNETQGRYTFAAGGGRTAFQNFLTGNRDRLCGATCTYTEALTDLYSQLRFNRYEAFVQDTWRASDRLTVDLGVRYALYPAVADKDNVLSNVDLSRYNRAAAPTPANANASAFVVNTGDPLNGIIVAGQNSPFGRAIYETDKNNFMPRLGLTYDPTGTGRTILRTGYGLYYDQPLVGIFLQNAFINPPFNASATVQNPVLGNPAAGLTPTTRGALGLRGTGLPFRTPQTQQWNIGIQRQLYARGAIDVGYVGSRGDNLLRPIDVNQAQPADVLRVGSAAINTVRPYFGYGGITIIDTTAKSRYHGLLASFRHDAGRAGTLSLAYTLSRNRTDATNDRDAIDIPQNPLNLAAEWADARTDRRHIFNANYIYELPFFRTATQPLLKALLGGWQVSGITTLQSGAPVPRIVGPTSGGTRGNRVNVIGDPQAGNLPWPQWFDPAAFAPANPGEYGNSPRAPLRLPGRNQTDLAMSKNFYPWAKRVQFRADAINVFNHTQFTSVNADCSGAPATATSCAFSGSTVGNITGARAPREFQFSVKLYW
ncbi:MAG TPA: carboxypeptidase regulatory-like domain-containing protein [Vicinamibacterales bacterium]|nr:carboxypeptidase regulatory-like domain-containing protein [Vicinamibacterales bacterium]